MWDLSEVMGLEPSHWAMNNPMSNRVTIDNDRDKNNNDRETRMNNEEEIKVEKKR